MINKHLLFRLYEIHSPSGREKKMRRFLKRQVTNLGATFHQDTAGNLLVTKGVSDTYPCMAAHIDQVQQLHSKDFRCITDGEVVFGFSPKSHKQQGLGADDKNGIYVCLEALARFDTLKVAFFVGEEVGCQGSSFVDLDFFSDCRFIIEPDRRGASDLITSMSVGDVCSADFIQAMQAERFGYSEDQGSITDVGELVSRGVGISCLNLSCGYYEAHTDREFTVLSELDNCLQFVFSIIENCTDVFPFEYKSYHHDYYDMWSYDEDYDMMDSLLQMFPDMSFQDMMDNWGMNFSTRDIKTLQSIYEDCSMSQKLFGSKKWWQDENA